MTTDNNKGGLAQEDDNGELIQPNNISATLDEMAEEFGQNSVELIHQFINENPKQDKT